MTSTIVSRARPCAMVALALGVACAVAPALAQTSQLKTSQLKTAQLKTWRHGVLEAKSDAGFVFMAAKGGFAEKQGLKIEMVQFKGDALALRAMLAGEIDSYEGNPGGPLIAASRGAALKILGCYWPILNYGIFTKSTITGPQNLKGKAFAISSPGSLPDLLARAVLEKNGLTGDDVKFAVMGSDSDRFRALTGGVVDAAAASTEFVPLAARSNVKLLIHAIDAVPNYLRYCLYTGSKTLANRADDTAHFLAAEMAGLRYAMDNRDKMVALSKEVTDAKADDPRAAYIFDEVKRYSSITPDLPVSLDKLNWMQDLFVRTGNLAKPIDIKTIIDGSAREKALALVGK
jgi:NitT/TauT family transport system substrate-binding protein